MTEFRHVPVLVHEIHLDRCEQMRAVFALYLRKKYLNLLIIQKAVAKLYNIP